MGVKKKPEDETLKSWCRAWQASDHEGKVELCEKYGISYEVGRHWYSDAPIELKEEPQAMTITAEELLGKRPAINLDFVSFDLETSNLEADFSIILSAVIKPFGRDPIVFRADNYPEWTTNRANDHSITKAISDELRKHAIIIAHYGIYFDTPYLRFKMVKHSLPPLPQMFAIDSWTIAKKNFKVSSRRLGALTEAFGLGEKEGVKGALWMAAAYSGNKEALDKIVEHNIRDCRLLETLACLTFPYVKSIPKL